LKTAPPESPVLGSDALPESILRPVEEVFARAQGMGAPPVEAVIVEDRDGNWSRLLLDLPLSRRRRTVLVFRSAGALNLAGRLSVGGALPFPPSSLRAGRAAEAASREVPGLPAMDPARLDEIRSRGWIPLLPEPLQAWRKILGARGMMELFGELADAVGIPAALDDSGFLYLPPEIPDSTIRDAFPRLPSRPIWACPEMLQIGGLLESKAPVIELISAALGRLPEGDFPGSFRLWCSSKPLRWELQGLPGSVADAVDPENPPDADILRLPSWLHLDLGTPGTPGMELLKLWGRLPRSFRLWIPNLRSDGLEAVLALKRSILVDGPVLPRGN